ncbi:uncharacterized protein [Clytia hemisphaerica]|uniref:Cation channel sperm-associated protein subunit beta C-terminal domain-containing protein n=1 Tax=Clytia hemisphaerica TaxID=252671 RepID=A0A7M5X766_9CNID
MEFFNYQFVYMVCLVSFWQAHLTLQLDFECTYNGTTLADNVKIFLDLEENGTSNLVCMKMQNQGFVEELKMSVSSSDTDLVTLIFNSTWTSEKVLNISDHDIFKTNNPPSFNMKILVCEIYYVDALHENVTIIKFLAVTAHRSFSQYQRTFGLDDSKHVVAESPCSSIVSYWIPKMLSETKNSLHLKISNETLLMIPILMSESQKISENSTVTRFVVMNNHIILVVDNQWLWKGTLELSGDVRITKASSNRVQVHLLTTTIHCPITDTPGVAGFETALLVHQIGNDTFLNIYAPPIESTPLYTVTLTNITGVDIIDVKYDYGKRQVVVLLVTNTVHAFSLSGTLQCAPVILKDTHIKNQSRLLVKCNLLLIVTNEIVVWTSTNGGCNWKRPIQWNNILHADFEFHSADTLKLTSNITSSYGTPLESYRDYDILWTKIGFLRPQTALNNSNYMLLLNDKIPESNNPYLDLDIFAVTETAEGFQLEFTPNETKFPEIWIGSLVKLGDYSCRVTAVFNATVEIYCYNSSLTFTNIIDFIQQRRWFSVDFFYARKVECHLSFNVNTTTIVFQKKPDTEIDHVFFSTPPLHAGTKETNSSVAWTFKDPLTSIPSSSNQVCLYQKYKTFQEYIYQNPTDCPITFTVTGINESYIHLDIDEHLEISVNLTIDMIVPLHEDISDLDWLKTQVSNHEIVCLRTHREKSRRAEKIRLQFHQSLAMSSINVVTIKSSIYNPKCGGQSLKFQILNVCPPNKKVIFEYPKSIQPNDFAYDDQKQDSEGIIRVFHLPTNYQPPSSKGIGIPQTPHVYNADPAKPMFHKKYLANQIDPVFKQCKDKRNRTMCGCTKPMEISTKISQSDCIKKVYRLLYPEKFVPRLLLQQKAKNNTAFDKLMRLSELNSRTDYTLTNSVRVSNGAEAVDMKSNTTIELKGSGLYHFQLDVFDKNVSYCNFETEFLVYVDGTPLPKAVESLVEAFTAFVFGFILLGLFLYQYYKK